MRASRIIPYEYLVHVIRSPFHRLFPPSEQSRGVRERRSGFNCSVTHSCGLEGRWSLDLHVLHFNHGTLSQRRRRIRSWLEHTTGGVRVHVAPAKPFEAANFQAKARAWRREEAQKLMDQVGAQVILQGHHADDQTELSLKLLHGCHLSRVSGIAPDGKFGRPY